MKQNKVVTYMRSVSFALIIAIISMLVQSPHSYTAFYQTSSIKNAWGVAQAVVFAFVIDLAVLFYTLRKRTDIALGAAAVMTIINMYYYWVAWGWSFNFAFGCFLSLIIPVSVYFYSEEIEIYPSEEKKAVIGERGRELEYTEDDTFIVRVSGDEDKSLLNVTDTPPAKQGPFNPTVTNR